MKPVKRSGKRDSFVPFKNERWNRVYALLLVFAFLNLSISCSYYKVRKINNNLDPVTQELKQEDPDAYAIIHQPSGARLHLYEIKVDEQKNQISGRVGELSSSHQLGDPMVVGKSYRYSPKSESPVNEIHFYLKNNKDIQPGEKLELNLSDIGKITVNDKNTGRTVVSIVALSIGALALVLIVYALTKSSCPFIYVEDNGAFVFTGELYPGAITPNLQRDDYLQLPEANIKPEGYTIKITNELHEIQYTDMLQLISVDHTKDVKVAVDQNGDFHSFSELNSPTRVLMNGEFSNLSPSLKSDSIYYSFDWKSQEDLSSRNLVLEFEKPEAPETGKLFLRLKNSFFLDYAFGKFNEQFGTYYEKFQKQQARVTAEKSNQWASEQNIPLDVYLKTTSGWKLIDQLKSVGPMAFRDVAVSIDPVDLKNNPSDKIVLKLETGFMFWEIDYVAMDFTPNANLEIDTYKPVKAIDENGLDVNEFISSKDKKFLIQPEVGNEVVVDFIPKPLDPGLKRSYFLKNSGYYIYIRDYQGQPDFAKLKTFRNKGAFTEFAEELYLDFKKNSKPFSIAMSNE